MAIKLEAREFFTEKLDENFEGLAGIGKAFTELGEERAEKQFADFIRGGGLDTERFFSGVPAPELTEKLIAEGDRILDGWLSSNGVPMQFPGRKVDWFANPTYLTIPPLPSTSTIRGGTVAVATVLVPTRNEKNPITGVDCDTDGNVTVTTEKQDTPLIRLSTENGGSKSVNQTYKRGIFRGET